MFDHRCRTGRIVAIIRLELQPAQAFQRRRSYPFLREQLLRFFVKRGSLTVNMYTSRLKFA